MDLGFVIMRIGNSKLDELWENIFIPALKECGLSPKRIDKHNEGRLLTSEIADFINKAKIIIADLTDERPNCYLEVGYTMGRGKFANLILCANKHTKIHFDLSAYDTLRWDSVNLESFKTDLVAKIRYRMKTISNLSEQPETDKNLELWIEDERKKAKGMFKRNGFLEVIFRPLVNINKKNVIELKEIAERITCNNGWPIGVVLHKDSYGPKPDELGIRSIYPQQDLFDYWILRKDGGFYFFRNLTDNGSREKMMLFWDEVVAQLSEIFLYCSRLYKEFGLNKMEKIRIAINYSGLNGRKIGVFDPNKLPPQHRYCNTDFVSYERDVNLQDMDSDFEDLIYEVFSNLISHFDYMQISKDGISGYIKTFLHENL